MGISIYKNKISSETYIFIVILFLSRLHTGFSATGFNHDMTIIPVIEKSIPVMEVSSDKISNRIVYLSSSGDKRGLLAFADSLRRSLSEKSYDSAHISEIYYYAGVCNMFALKYEDAIDYLTQSIEISDRLDKRNEEQYIKAFYNLGVAYNHLGDYSNVKSHLVKYIDLSKRFYGENSTEVGSAIAILIGAAIVNNDFKNFINYTDRALSILKTFQDKDLSNLYTTIGTGYSIMGDYAKARLYFEQAESVIESNRIPQDQNYITLINSMAINYGYLGMDSKEEEYFTKGLDLAVKDNSFLAFNMVHTYAVTLGNSGNVRKGEMLLSDLLRRSEKYYGTDSRYYIEVLKNYATYLLNYKNDSKSAIKYFSACDDYLMRHREDASLRDQVYEGYARALHHNGQSKEALEKIQELLFNGSLHSIPEGSIENPEIDSIRADRRYIRILRSKYEIVKDIYSQTGDGKILKAAAATSDLIINVIEKIRINISEEESRLVLGDHYRDSYLMAIRDFEQCYKIFGDRSFLEKAFEIAEKSKVAGLLAATRELNAIQFHIPQDIADLEKSLQRDIGVLNSRISLENDREKPDTKLLKQLNDEILAAIRVRDSLVLTFENEYPGYYTLKYNTKAPEMKDIPQIVGRNSNYINYIVSDSMLYIFIVNRKHRELITVRTDSLLIRNLMKFRVLLSNPSFVKNPGNAFREYQDVGNDLYRILIEPISKYLISRNLLISPDNYLSYLPFETILTDKYEGEGLLYRKLDYLMNDFNISYAYSATLMHEIVSRDIRGRNKLAAFSPFYGSDINVDSLFARKQQGSGLLYDLPYARQEAEFVAGISRGSLYLNDKATESVFKSVAGDFNIIHLAMHTYLNDQHPMNSAMIFSQGNDNPEDGLLYTYEVYGIPLNARMVVLSSCNTGTGRLSTGEGILSLARGFLYSGSQSMVMSMWEIEDKSGTEIINRFYRNLRNGNTKSTALRKSRSAYLKKATQLKSHPYFWATLVVYGDNSPVYFPGRTLLVFLITAVAAGIAILIYLRKRKYS
ncbi:MAG TPA: CHAT domain-containing protein [Bacteroidales bacterium]|mgnify:FL=1|nr:CHAT domain-containing protein [Bacteroidales bacterium]